MRPFLLYDDGRTPKQLMGKLGYDTVSRFLNAKIPGELEDELLVAYATCTEGQDDMTAAQLPAFFEDLQLPKEWYELVSPSRVCIEGTDIVDFEKLMSATYRLLIFMDNEKTIDEHWELLLGASQRAERFGRVPARKQAVTLKDLQRCAAHVGMEPEQSVEMLAWATGGSRVYVTYLDFAYLLGKLGYLHF